MSKNRKASTPVRKGLKTDSVLQNSVENGLGAIESKDKNCFDRSIRTSFLDSLNLDKAMVDQYNQSNRWDYLLGLAQSGKIIGVEPHSGRDDEVAVVIRKKEQALLQIRDHLKNGVKIDKWIWVSSGRSKFPRFDKVTLQLSQKGIKYVGRAIRLEDLV